jgi:hypothetical protein
VLGSSAAALFRITCSLCVIGWLSCISCSRSSRHLTPCAAALHVLTGLQQQQQQQQRGGGTAEYEFPLPKNMPCSCLPAAPHVLTGLQQQRGGGAAQL